MKKLSLLLSMWCIAILGYGQTPVPLKGGLVGRATSAVSLKIGSPFRWQILVQAGDEVTVRVSLKNETNKKSLKRALLSGILTGGTVSGVPVMPSEASTERSSRRFGLSFGSSLSVFSILSAPKQRGYLLLKSYDRYNNIVHSQIQFAPTTMRHNSREVVLTYKAQQDGRIDVQLGNAGKGTVVAQAFQIQRLANKSSQSTDSQNMETSSIKGISPGGDGPQTNDFCIDWYIVSYDYMGNPTGSETYVGTSCGRADGEGFPPPDSGGGGPANTNICDNFFARLLGFPPGLNDCECAWTRANIDASQEVLNNVHQADDWMNSQQGHAYFSQFWVDSYATDDDGPNAFRHALWQALNTCDLGQQVANTVATNHETCDGVIRNTLKQFNMDTGNNITGINVGAQLQAQNACDFNSVLSHIKAAYENGVLRQIGNCPNPDSFGLCPTP